MSITIDPEAGDAVYDAYFAYKRLAEAKTPLDAAYAMTALSEAMSDVASWLPGYDLNTGEVINADS